MHSSSVWVNIHISACTHVGSCVWMPGVNTRCLPALLSILRWDLLLNTEDTYWASLTSLISTLTTTLTGPLVPENSVSVSWGQRLQVDLLYMVVGDSGPQVCTARASSCWAIPSLLLLQSLLCVLLLPPHLLSLLFIVILSGLKSGHVFLFGSI